MDPDLHAESKITASNLAVGTGVFSPMRHSVIHKYNTNQHKLLAQFRRFGFQRGSATGTETWFATDADLPAQ